MSKFKSRKCHKCKYTSKSKNLVQLKNGNPVCEKYKKGIPDEVFFNGRYCKYFELVNKYNIVEMVDNLIKKLKNEQPKNEKESKPKKSKVISINKNAN